MPVEEFERYTESQRKASLLAQRELAMLWDRLDKSKPEECRDALLAVVPGIIYRYGDMAALAAAQYYEAERSAVRSDSFECLLSEGVPYEQIEASIRYAAGHLFPPDYEDGDGVQPESHRSLFSGQD